MKNVQLSYTPVLPIGRIHHVEKEYESDLNFWAENPLFYHPNLLVNYYYSKEVKNKEVYKNIKRDIKGQYFGDSGGYQTMSVDGGVNIDPLDVLRWQEENVNIGIGLDEALPGYNAEDDMFDFNTTFLHCAEKSAKNFEIQSKNIQNNDFKYLTVLHGTTLERLNYWWNLIKDIPSDGYSIATRNNNVFNTALFYCFLKDRIDSNKIIHSLAGSGMKIFPILLKFSKYWGQNFTFDNSFVMHDTRMKAYYVESGIDLIMKKSNAKILYIGRNSHIDENLEPPCNCGVCKKYGLKTLMQDNNLGYIALENHNLKVMLDSMELVGKVSEFPEFEQYLHPTTKIALQFIDFADKEGLEKAVIKYKPYFMAEMNEIKKQAALDKWA